MEEQKPNLKEELNILTQVACPNLQCKQIVQLFVGIMDRGDYVEIYLSCGHCGMCFPLTFLKQDLIPEAERGKEDRSYTG